MINVDVWDSNFSALCNRTVQAWRAVKQAGDHGDYVCSSGDGGMILLGGCR